MSTISDLHDRKARHIVEARSVDEKAKAENRPHTAEERQVIDRHLDEAAGVDAQIAEHTATEQRRARLSAVEEESRRSAGRKAPPGAGTDPPTEAHAEEIRAYQYAAEFAQRIERRLGDKGLTLYRSAWDTYAREGRAGLTYEEQRALAVGSGPTGGYLVPMLWANQLIEAVRDSLWIRQLATVTPISQATSIRLPKLTARPSDADWTAELLSGDADSAMTFGGVELFPHPLAKRLLVSNTLLRLAMLNVEQLVNDQFAYIFSVTEEKGFLTGTGVEQPLGVFTASSDGVSTARDVSTGNTTTTIKADNLIEVKYSLKQAYWDRANWVFHRSAVKQLRLMKDGEGQYLWQTALMAGEQDMLLGMPVRTSEYAPSTFTTGQYVGILGDFSRYQIVDVLPFSLQRLDELKAETNQVEFIMRRETGGAPVLEEAFARVKLA